MQQTNPYVVCALYKFVNLFDYQAMRSPLLEVMNHHGIKGSLLLAEEGINGTVAGTQQGIDALLVYLKSDPRLTDIDYKLSYHDNKPFYRTKVKLKKEIVTLGVNGIHPPEMAGHYVEPADWNDLISDPETLTIDTRNEYEIAIGTFKYAVNPHTETFRQFPKYVENNLKNSRYQRIAMFCTGGIRCEKSTAYLRQYGFDEVYHLKGGILKYLEQIPEEDSLWQGECFVFDDRVAVTHALRQGSYDQCYACRMPITEADKQRDTYEKGVSCHHCYDRLTPEQKQRFAERQYQQTLAKQRGQAHIGAEANITAEQRRQQKQQQKQQQRNKMHTPHET